MGTRNFFSHTNPDGITFDQRITAAGYNYQPPAAGENIAGAFSSPYSVMFGTTNLDTLSDFDINMAGGDGFADWNEVGMGWNDSIWNSWGDGWMGSSGHRNNILNSIFDDIGIGYAMVSGSTFVHYWTQTFAAGDSAIQIPLPGTLLLILTGLLPLLVFWTRS
jgi:uncharacterized protein YkwD